MLLNLSKRQNIRHPVCPNWCTVDSVPTAFGSEPTEFDSVPTTLGSIPTSYGSVPTAFD